MAGRVIITKLIEFIKTMKNSLSFDESKEVKT